MSTHILHPEKDAFYFCTATCFNWMNLFEITKLYDHIYDWFDILYQKNCFINRYVIMPNHFHIILYQKINSISLNKLFSNGKRFMAYEIVDRLEIMGNDSLLKFLEISVPPNEKIKKKKHQVFISSFDARLCDSVEMIE